MILSDKAKNIIGHGSVKIRVLRNGMFQQMTFTVRQVHHGNIVYLELYTDRQIDITELAKAANDVGLPIEASNGKAFPSGTSASDFQEERKEAAPSA